VSGVIRADTGAVVDLTSTGPFIFNQTPGGAGSFSLQGGRIAINGSITNQATLGNGGSFALLNNVNGFGTLQITGGTLTGQSGAYVFLAAKNGTLTIDLTPGVGLQNLVLGPNTGFPGTDTMVFTNSFTFTSISTSNPAHIQPA